MSTMHIGQAAVHNLRHVDLEIPHHRLVVITGVSGSGKSSLAFDTICREAQRRYLESFSAHARRLLGKLARPDAARLDGLSPAIAVDQKTCVRNPRSTVGTLSELHDHLRLLFARCGRRLDATPDAPPLTRSLFSFNGPGACPACRGLGVEDAIDVGKLVAHPDRTLREGALAITTDSGYIIYSQVTMEVLDQVCRAHDFTVDIPWRDLTDAQRHVVLYGSDRITIAFGKHTLESRLKWSGITARPRQEGHYGGIIPVMEGILRRDRNKNILRFARTDPCRECGGARLRPEALAVRVGGHSIAEMASWTVAELDAWFREHDLDETGRAVAAGILRRTGLLRDLGLDYLTLDRPAPSLSGGEAQRIRLASVAGAGLRGLTYVLDEPSVGLHPRDNDRLLRVLRRLVDQGNSVLVVEHDRATMRAADWLVDIGPGAGGEGGRVLFSGPPADLLTGTDDPDRLASRTRACLLEPPTAPTASPRPDAGMIAVHNARRHNLRGIDVELHRGALNVITGVSGAGKSSLLADIAASSDGRTITVDQMPIGRTPRSNPATYTGLFDRIRALFAAQPAAKQRGLGRAAFSFNTRGGRCEACQGAGVERIGMHFLGDVEVPCPACGGRRFAPEVLAVTVGDRSIHDVLEMSIARAAEFFADEPKLRPMLAALVDLGLGYIPLGQRSTTLSGGEAQRVKLATEIGRHTTGKTLYLLDEPTTGLHPADVVHLLRALGRLADQGHTVVVTEHDLDVVRAADHVIDLGPGSGDQGGRLLFAGPPADLAAAGQSPTADALRSADRPAAATVAPDPAVLTAPIELRGVQTHNLRDLDVDIPAGRITAVTGVSGSGKSSLAMDTLCAEGRSRYAEHFSTHVRQQLVGRIQADLAGCRGLGPTIAVGQQAGSGSPRSIVATTAEIHPLLRLLFSRAGRTDLPAGAFSFNTHDGACPACRGLGTVTVGDPDKLVTHPDRSLLAGALDGHKTGRYYGEPDGRYTATLRQVGQELSLDFSLPWRDLDPRARAVAMHGAGAREYEVRWHYQRGKRSGVHELTTPWPGFCGLVAEEYERKHADGRGQAMLAVMTDRVCSACDGRRLHPEALAVTVGGRNIHDLCALTATQARAWLAALDDPRALRLTDLRDELDRRLATLEDVGLGYLGLNRRTTSLSGGEARRLHLARQLGARLRHVTYVLDEPTLGLHPRDVSRLWRAIEQLRDQGNTVVIVEHDPQVILAADHVIDIGPGPGRDGGRLVACGTPAEIMACDASVTGRCLRERADSPAAPAPAAATDGHVAVRGAALHNLAGIDVAFPVGRLTAVTGVSGSGKSSLLFGVLAASAAADRATGCASVEGLDRFDAVIPVRQGRTAAAAGSMPVTACGALDPIRALLAGTDAARAAGLKKRHFTPNQRGGRCETCQGQGSIRMSLDFLSDIRTVCPDCRGRRFQPHVLACTWRDRSIADILELTAAEALDLFADQPRIARRLAPVTDAGLGYVPLGQATASLSGGERQRLHLACELLPDRKGRNLYLCDEPSAGLHMADVERLSGVLRKLVEAGHTVIVAEHDGGLIAAADRVVELGPGGGPDGGRLIRGAE